MSVPPSTLLILYMLGPTVCTFRSTALPPGLDANGATFWTLAALAETAGTRTWDTESCMYHVPCTMYSARVRYALSDMQ
jgi:hypothetical protein